MAGTASDVITPSSDMVLTFATSDALGQTQVQELGISAEEAGIVEVFCTGRTKAGDTVTGVKFVRYKRDSVGVLTIGTVGTALAVQADSAINTATFTIIVSSNNIGIQVTGVSGKIIAWSCAVYKPAVSTQIF